MPIVQVYYQPDYLASIARQRLCRAIQEEGMKLFSVPELQLETTDFKVFFHMINEEDSMEDCDVAVMVYLNSFEERLVLAETNVAVMADALAKALEELEVKEDTVIDVSLLHGQISWTKATAKRNYIDPGGR